MKRFISLAVVVGVLILGACMLSAQDIQNNVANTGVLRQAGPAYFYNEIFYGPQGVQEMPAMITGTATNAQAYVSFGVTFKSAPILFLSWKDTQAANGGTNELWATSVTTTNFVPKTTMAAGGAYTNISWIAFGLLF